MRKTRRNNLDNLGHARSRAYPYLKHAAGAMRKHPTPAEARLWSCLKGGLLGSRFLRQHVIGMYIVDFCCPDRRLVIEVDGSIHNTPEQSARDAVRQRYLIDLGFAVLRFSNSQVFTNLRSVKSAIRSALK
jgi:very-short-patch-repair endonuclease